MPAVAQIKPTQLRVRGMHCAGCVSAVEQALQRVPSVERAAVNLTTETATVWARNGVGSQDLIAAVKSAGYDAEIQPDNASFAQRGAERSHALRRQLRRLLIASPLTIPVILSHMAHHSFAQLGLPHAAAGVVQGLLT